jgi:hypothetical protein
MVALVCVTYFAAASFAKRCAMIRPVFSARNELWVALCALGGLVSGCGRVSVELLSFDASTPDGSVSACVCENAHGTADCGSGRCEITCQSGYADCDANLQNGCETSVADGAAGCGECTVSCANPNGTTSCQQGLCVPVCTPEAGDCDGNAQNGCEEVLRSVDHCGACDAACSNAHGTTECASGVCTPSCEAGYESCDANAQNGCETRVASDPMHCGDCTTTCDPSFQVCTSGSCQVSTCPMGVADCDANTADCETPLGTVGDCGFCGDACNAVQASAACTAGACTLASCNAGYADCDAMYQTGCEVATGSNVQHCGSCNNPCTNPHGSISCAAGVCAPGCASGWGSCDSNPQNGCETALDSVTHCGMCNRACTTNLSGATPVCSAGACTSACLNGVYALRLAIDVDWSAPFIQDGSGTMVYWARLVLSQSDTAVSGSVTLCGQTVPDFQNSVVAERYGVSYAATVFEQSIPAIPVAGTFTDAATSSFSLNRTALLMGATLADPINGTWPSLSAINGVDHDNDGFRGVTVDYRSGGGYTFPPTSAVFFPPPPRARQGDAAHRMRFQLGGNLTSCTAASGSATINSIETHTMGCRIDGGGNCSSGQYTHLDDNDPRYTANSASFSLTKLGNTGATVTCSAVRAALP